MEDAKKADIIINKEECYYETQEKKNISYS